MAFLKIATEINGQLGASPFLGGKEPTDKDIKAFNQLIGKDNAHFWRWVKHIASFPAEERKAWQPPKKAGLVAKSSIVLDIKPWDDETDLNELERLVRAKEINGLHWGASKLVPIAFGVKKLQIMLTIEDELVTSDDIEDAIMSFGDHVQSMDVVAWNKV